MKLNLIKFFIPLALVLFSLNILSCSDITSLSKEQIKEFSVRIDGAGTLDGDMSPLYLLNDNAFPVELLNRIKPIYIDSISVLKGDVATQIYGEDGRYGVVKIYAPKKILDDLEPDTTK
ncbi:MAG TPA: hypothetical protein VJ941_12380 [Gracilimonas sp.]|nr:hypothetical protein [Gracilimonas sp.]